MFNLDRNIVSQKKFLVLVAFVFLWIIFFVCFLGLGQTGVVAFSTYEFINQQLPFGGQENVTRVTSPIFSTETKSYSATRNGKLPFGWQGNDTRVASPALSTDTKGNDNGTRNTGDNNDILPYEYVTVKENKYNNKNASNKSFTTSKEIETTAVVPTEVASVDSEKETLEKIGKLLRSREKRLRDTCKKNFSFFEGRTKSSIQNRLFRNDHYKLMYCAIPKIGSSFWKRIFKVIDLSHNKGVHLFDMPSMSAHIGMKGTISMAHSSRTFFQHVLQHYTSFMVTRDPFSRLFSAYVDKLVLPNSLGGSYGNAIRKKYGIDVCPLNVTFEHISRYLGDCLLKGHCYIDQHFSPTYDQCRPCNVKFTYLAKMETFMDDTKYILSSVGVSYANVTGREEDSESDSLNDKGLIEDLASRTLKYVAQIHTPCLSNRDVLARLWRTYQMRGIISKNDRFPHFDDVDHISMKEFVLAAKKVYDESTTSREERMLQREEALLLAYSSLPTYVLMRLGHVFTNDCLLYDYDCDVSKRFPKSAKVKFPYFDFDFKHI